MVRAADAGDNGGLVVEGTATEAGKCRGFSAMAQAETRMCRAESRRQEPRWRQRLGSSGNGGSDQGFAREGGYEVID